MALLAVLVVMALTLTCSMFHTRQSMLGFAAAMFWAITGAQAYTLSTTPWGDIYFYVFFASAFGMTVFCSIAGFGLREKKDTYADQEMDEEDGERDETAEKDNTYHDESTQPGERTRKVRARAEKRRTRQPGEKEQPKKKKERWGEFQ